MEVELKRFYLLANPFYLVYEDPPETVEEEEEEELEEKDPPKMPPVKKLKVALTDDQQAFVNSLLAEERRKAQVANKKTITQLETLRNSANTTAAEKLELETQIEDLKNQHLTTEELRKKETTKKETKLQQERDAALANADTWKNKFTDSTIRRSLTDAAIKNHANNPEHIVTFLYGNTRLVEDKDEEGKPTGDFTPMVKLKTTTKEGKPQTLDMAVTEAVKFLSEQEEHESLFNSGASGGLGGNNNPSRKKSGVDSDTPPKDPAKYREWRAAQKKAGKM